MANSPHAIPTNCDFTPDASTFKSAKPIHSSQLSLSQLLGRDYLFIDFSERPAPKTEKDFNEALESLFNDLGLTPTDTLVVGIVQGLEANQFNRYDLTWLSNKIRRFDLVEIKTPEQNAFMQMIWQCTSPIPEF